MNLVWFRNDLRVDDNPALFNACQKANQQVIAVYFISFEQWKKHQVGSNQQRLTIKALTHLKQQLDKLNITFWVIKSAGFTSLPQELQQLCKALSVSNLYFNNEYPFNERIRDNQVEDQLKNQLHIHRFNADSLVDPALILNGSGQPYKVFTPYSKSVYQFIHAHGLFCYSPPSRRSSENLRILTRQSNRYTQVSLKLLASDISSNSENPPLPNISESHLYQKLIQFCVENIGDYQHHRDFPEMTATTVLSHGLAIGAISSKRCFQTAIDISPQTSKTWTNQLVWRDFYRAVMWHFPRVSQSKAFNPIESRLTWSRDPEKLKHWQQGTTGIPIIDAAIRQLKATGWMHNRLRMITASYLCKNLWLDWRLGETFFAQHLFDYDFANNNGGWQWSASIGTDAAPYFRVFSPVSQQQKFDPDAHFIKHWIPELRRFSARQIHQLESGSLTHYHAPQVDLKSSRKAAIEMFKLAKEA